MSLFLKTDRQRTIVCKTGDWLCEGKGTGERQQLLHPLPISSCRKSRHNIVKKTIIPNIGIVLHTRKQLRHR